MLPSLSRLNDPERVAGVDRMIDLRDSVCAVALACGTVLVVPGSPVTLLEVEPGSPLGVLPSSEDEVTLDLPLGALVVLDGDGLVERRDESLTQGPGRLRLVVEQAAELNDLEQIADRILEDLGLTGRGGSGDIALLVLRPLSRPPLRDEERSPRVGCVQC